CPIARLDAALVEAHLFIQRPARRLDDAALDLVLQPVRIDDQSGIGRSPDVGYANLAGDAIDLDIGNTGHITRKVLVLGEAQASPTAKTARLAGLPTRHRRDLLDRRARARVLQ